MRMLKSWPALLTLAVGASCAVLLAWTMLTPRDPAPQSRLAKPSDHPAAASEPQAASKTPQKPVVDPLGLDALTGVLGDRRGQPADRTESGPVFDVARIDSSGEAVIAGRTAPGATVELLRAGDVHDSTVADQSGEFVMIPKPLPAGDYQLTLRATQPDGKVATSKGSVSVALRGNSETPATATPKNALKPPAQAPAQSASQAPSQSASQAPSQAPSQSASTAPSAAPSVVEPSRAPVPAAVPRVAIAGVESEAGGKLSISGRSAPDTTVRLYLNDAYVASATADADGRVTFIIGSGVVPGDYRIRLDQVDAPSGAVRSRAEVSFNAPATPPSLATTPSLATPRVSEPAAVARPDPVRPSAAQPSVIANKEAAAQTAPPREVAQPTPEVAQPRPEIAQPKPEVAQPKPEVAQPKPEVAQPKPEVAQPRLEVAQPKPEAAQPKLEAAQPKAGIAAAAEQQSATSEFKAPQRGPEAPEVADKSLVPVEKPAPPESPQASAPQPAPGEGASVVVIPRIDTTVVSRGDNLWRISRSAYGQGVRYSVIYDANRSQIRDPDLIYPGQIFVLPKAAPGG